MRYRVHVESFAGWVEAPTRGVAYYRACKRFGTVTMVVPCAGIDDEDRFDRERLKFLGYLNNDVDDDGA